MKNIYFHNYFYCNITSVSSLMRSFETVNIKYVKNINNIGNIPNLTWYNILEAKIIYNCYCMRMMCTYVYVV